MKTLLVSSFVLLSACVSWSKTDLVLEGAFVAVMAVDATQTMAANSGLETNPIMGRSPNATTAMIYFATASIFHAGVAVLLPGKWRNAWQGVWIGAEAIQIWKNAVLPHPDSNAYVRPVEYR